jgi:hypothetical protein
MQLMTKDIEAKIPALGVTEELGNKARVWVKFFDPSGSWNWYATEYEPSTGVCFGLVHGFEDELGYFTLGELESASGPLGLGIERDMYWDNTKTLGEVQDALGRGDVL